MLGRRPGTGTTSPIKDPLIDEAEKALFEANQSFCERFLIVDCHNCPRKVYCVGRWDICIGDPDRVKLGRRNLQQYKTQIGTVSTLFLLGLVFIDSRLVHVPPAVFTIPTWRAF